MSLNINFSVQFIIHDHSQMFVCFGLWQCNIEESSKALKPPNLFLFVKRKRSILLGLIVGPFSYSLILNYIKGPLHKGTYTYKDHQVVSIALCKQIFFIEYAKKSSLTRIPLKLTSLLEDIDLIHLTTLGEMFISSRKLQMESNDVLSNAPSISEMPEYRALVGRVPSLS